MDLYLGWWWVIVRFLWWVVVDSFRVWLVMLGIFWVVVGDSGGFLG